MSDNLRVLVYVIEDHIKDLISLEQLKTLVLESFEESGDSKTTKLILFDLEIINFGGFLAPNSKKIHLTLVM